MPPHRTALSSPRMPVSSYPYALAPSDDLVEVVDTHDRPLMLMPLGQAEEQGLPFRGVRVLLCDAQGRALLVRSTREDGTAGLWTLPSARVRGGEPREAAALRALEQSVGITDVLMRAAEKKDSFKNPRNSIFVAFLSAHAPTPRAASISEILFLDSDELHGLAEYFPTLLEPELLRCLSENYMESLLAECKSLHNS